MGSTRTPEKSNASGDSDASNESQWEQNLSEAFGRLFYSHRKELYHVWHSNFDLDESKSLAKEDFVSMLRERTPTRTGTMGRRHHHITLRRCSASLSLSSRCSVSLSKGKQPSSQTS